MSATRYGRGSFGSGCLMARRLVERGVTYVEVSLDGWDTHANNFDTLSRRLLPELDKGMSALVADLAARRLLDTTTIVWMGEFGRTPRINQNAGRDHWPRSWSVVVGGGGMKNGQVVGATDKDGVDIVDHPIGVMDLIATIDQDHGHQPRDAIHDPARPADQDRRRRSADQGAGRVRARPAMLSVGKGTAAPVGRCPFSIGEFPVRSLIHDPFSSRQRQPHPPARISGPPV